MKLRILDNSIRLRLERSELRDLLREGIVERHLDFGQGTTFVYALHAVEQPDLLTATVGSGRIDLSVDARRATAWAASDEPGIAASQHAGDRELRLLVEKDFPCKHSDDGRVDEKFTASTMSIDADA
jgi:hypothetical protein